MNKVIIILMLISTAYAESVLDKNEWLKSEKFEELQELFSDEFSRDEYLESFEDVYKKENLNSEDLYNLITLRLKTDKTFKKAEQLERFEELPQNWKKISWIKDILLIQKLRDELQKLNDFVSRYPLMHPKKSYLTRELIDKLALTLDHKNEFEKNTLVKLLDIKTDLDDWQEVVLDILAFSLENEKFWSYNEIADLRKLKVKNLLQISHKDIGFNELKHPLEKLMWVFSRKEYNSWYADDLKNLIMASLYKIKILMKFYQSDDDLYELSVYLKGFLKDKDFDESWSLGQLLLAEIDSLRNFTKSSGAKAINKCETKESKYKALCEKISTSSHVEIESLYYSNKSELYLRLKKTSLKDLEARIYLSSFDLLTSNQADLEFEVLLTKENDFIIPKEFHGKKFHLVLLSKDKIISSFEIDTNLEGPGIGYFPLRHIKDRVFSFYIKEKLTEDLSFFHPTTGEFHSYSIKEIGLYQIKDIKTLGLWQVYHGANLISSFNVEENSIDLSYSYKRKTLKFDQALTEIDFSEFEKQNDFILKNTYSNKDLYKSIKKMNPMLLKTKKSKLNVKKLKSSYIVDINQEYYYFDQKNGLSKTPPLDKLIKYDFDFLLSDQLYLSLNNKVIIPFENGPKEKKWKLKDGQLEASQDNSLYGVIINNESLCPFEVKAADRNFVVKTVFRPRSFINLKNPFQFNIDQKKFSFDIFHDFVERLDNKILIKDEKLIIDPLQEGQKLCIVNDYI